MRDNLAIVKSILSKTVARGATVGEEASAVHKAVEMMGKYAIPHSAVASVWPKGWGFDGKRLQPGQQRKQQYDYQQHDFHDLSLLEQLFRATGGVYSRDFLREAIRRAEDAMAQYDRRGPGKRPSAETIRQYEEYIRRNSTHPGAGKGFRSTEFEDRVNRKAKEGARREQKPGSVGNYARQLLKSNIAGIGPYSYGHILGRIMDRYPDAKTTVASLRWYENEMRKQGLDIPKGRPAKG